MDEGSEKFRPWNAPYVRGVLRMGENEIGWGCAKPIGDCWFFEECCSGASGAGDDDDADPGGTGGKGADEDGSDEVNGWSGAWFGRLSLTR